MSEGLVAWFNEHLGYGAIVMEDKRTVFAHLSSFIGVSTLPRQNDKVEFDLYEKPDGRYIARNIRILSRA